MSDQDNVFCLRPPMRCVPSSDARQKAAAELWEAWMEATLPRNADAREAMTLFAATAYRWLVEQHSDDANAPVSVLGLFARLAQSHAENERPLPDDAA